MSIRALSIAFLAGTVLVVAQPVSAEEPAFRFDKRGYFLRSDENGLREYLPAGETFKKWNRLISVRTFEGIDDPRAYAMKVVEQAKASGPNANGQVMENGNSGTYIADFLVFSPEGTEPSYAEWNLMRIRKSGKGIQVVQYARRFFNIDKSTSKELVAERGKLVPLLDQFEIPR